MKMQLAVLRLARLVGIFRVAQILTRRRLRILCFHGLSMGDEHEVAPHMFLSRETFARRMAVVRRRVPVVSIEKAVEMLAAGTVSRAETVITFDDGWASSLQVAAPILGEFGFPWCVYVTTEHLDGSPEVFNVALDYMLRRTRVTQMVLQGVHAEIDGTYTITRDPTELHSKLVDLIERRVPDLSVRQRLLPRFAAALGQDISEVLREGRFNLLTADEMKHLSKSGVGIHLHTHSHLLPSQSFEETAAEVVKNQVALQRLTGSKSVHFCYPSGRYTADQPQWLRRLGIQSATTCDPGLNAPGADALTLRRYLDSELFSDIAFEAEICGFRDLVRDLRARFGRLASSPVKSIT